LHVNIVKHCTVTTPEDAEREAVKVANYIIVWLAFESLLRFEKNYDNLLALK